MGCCKSSLYISDSRFYSLNAMRNSSSFTQTEMLQLGILLSAVPDHCQEAIISLPARKLLNLYKYHLMALYHGLHREWSVAIAYEQRVIKGLQVLMPNEKDHYIFFHFYSVLSACFLALGELHAAIEGIETALAILLKHTPTDYKTISCHYYHLANVYKNDQNWAAAANYLTQAIKTARFINDLDLEFIYALETEFQEIR